MGLRYRVNLILVRWIAHVEYLVLMYSRSRYSCGLHTVHPVAGVMRPYYTHPVHFLAYL